MALVKYGAIVTDVRGKLGGTVFSRGGGGSIVRNWTKPTNPRSNRQEANRSQMSRLAQYWNGTLDQDARDDWNTFAANTPWVNALGQAIVLTGIAAYARLNAARLAAGLAMRVDAPLAYGLPGNPSATFTAQPTNGHLVFAEPVPPWDKSMTGHELIIFQHMPVPAGREAVPGPRQYVGRISGNVGTPPTFPYNIDVYYPVKEGERQWLTMVFQDESFRLGTGYAANMIAADPA
jgi:hypothetical protein